jgi:hypothetical protein
VIVPSRDENGDLDYAHPGDWTAICDRCDTKAPASALDDWVSGLACTDNSFCPPCIDATAAKLIRSARWVLLAARVSHALERLGGWVKARRRRR